MNDGLRRKILTMPKDEYSCAVLQDILCSLLDEINNLRGRVDYLDEGLADVDREGAR
jgi:hypothetical protein